MRWDEWQPIYLDIVERLGLDSAADRRATNLLTSLLEPIDPDPLLTKLSDLISEKQVVVCGAGPSLKQQLKPFSEKVKHTEFVFAVADGATSVMLELGLPCDVIVTDLDGTLDHLIEARNNGALFIVHAHGDNIDRVKSIVPRLSPVLGSTQVEPTSRAFLWGGFTDGDRACHVVSDYSPKKIILAGMDFGLTVGRWSKPGHDDHYLADERKRIKLEIAEELIARLLNRTKIEHEFLT
ncbi:MAG: 6-hydroxymethylpterin diphosphokinase MptE-like protein [Candidatus Thorarchaeota archaeon]